MGRAHGKKRRMKKTYRYNVNRKRVWKRSKVMPVIKCLPIKNSWDRTKGVYRNMSEMGLSSDPNRTFKIPRTETLMKQSFATYDPETDTKKEKRQPTKLFVVDELEKLASRPINSSFHVSNDIVLFVKYMVEKYGNNYKAMAKDPKNHYQLTPKQIKRRINDCYTSKLITAYKLANQENPSQDS